MIAALILSPLVTLGALAFARIVLLSRDGDREAAELAMYAAGRHESRIKELETRLADAERRARRRSRRVANESADTPETQHG